ncbi:hypothetical protein GC176_23500 [bacterium]|nr:hypothetical protein [bacterium]
MTTQVRFGASAEGLQAAGDDAFLAAVEWRGDTLKQFARNSDMTDLSLRTIGLCWKQQCVNRAVPQLSESVEFSSLNGALQNAEAGPLLVLLRDVRKAARRAEKKSDSNGFSKRLVGRLDCWLEDEAAGCEQCPQTLLASVELLVLHGGGLPATTLGRLWKATLSAAIAQADGFAEAADGVDWEELAAAEETDSLRWLQAGLLPWACGLLFDEVKGAPKVLKAGRKQLVDQLLLVTDENGIPVAPVLESLTEHLARWKDALLLSAVFARPLWKDEAETRLADALKSIAATLGADGRICGCLHDDGSAAALVVTLAELSGQKRSEKWFATARAIQAAVAAGTYCVETSPPRKAIREKDIPSWQSDDAEAACLRTSWVPGGSVVTLTFHRDPVGIELVADGTPLLVGPWGLSFKEDGESVELEDAWECVCWYSEGEVDYCELQHEFDDGSKLGRIVMLPRGRQFAILADVITGSPAQQVELTSELPLADGVEATRRKGTREWRLKAGRERVRLYPLALPQDAGVGTSNRADIEREDEQSSFVTSCVSASGGVFSPVLIDWAPHRRIATCEWSPLTVSEVMQIDRDGAAAWRVRFGSEQLIIFRALRPTERYRTVLGYQTEHETVIADFTKKGDFREILLVE